MDVSPLTRTRPELRKRRYRQAEEQEATAETEPEVSQTGEVTSFFDGETAFGKADITTATWLALREPLDSNKPWK